MTEAVNATTTEASVTRLTKKAGAADDTDA